MKAIVRDLMSSPPVTCHSTDSLAVAARRMTDAATTPEPHITVRDLDMAYGDFVIQRNLNFSIPRGDIFIIMGGSGCGKSTLLRHIIGSLKPDEGEIFIDGTEITKLNDQEMAQVRKRFGMLFQTGALFNSLTGVYTPQSGDGSAIPTSR